MSRPELLVARIHELDEQIGQARRELVAQRRAAIAELFELVGAVEAARLLGITPAAVYKNVYAARN
jgi:hypothetical protein